MAKITVKTDCSNSPKAEILRDFTVAFADSNLQFILDTIADDISWTIIGDIEVKGKVEVEEKLKGMLDGSYKELSIENIITHGDAGAVNGTMMFNDGSTFGFCDIYSFTSHAKDAKVKTLTSFIVELKK